MHHLQTVAESCPNLRKLSLEFDMWFLPEDELAGAADILVKFEEIDWTVGFVILEHTRAFLRTILRALPGESSKLKQRRRE